MFLTVKFPPNSSVQGLRFQAPQSYFLHSNKSKPILHDKGVHFSSTLVRVRAKEKRVARALCREHSSKVFLDDMILSSGK